MSLHVTNLKDKTIKYLNPIFKTKITKHNYPGKFTVVNQDLVQRHPVNGSQVVVVVVMIVVAVVVLVVVFVMAAVLVAVCLSS